MTSSSIAATAAPDTRSARIAQTAGYFAAFIAMGMYAAALGPTLPDLAAQTGVALSQVSILFSARAFGYLLGSVAIGRLYDRLAGHRVMAIMLLLMMAGMIAVPAVPLLPLLVAVFLFLGITEAGVDVGGNTLIIWRHGARVGPFMNAMHFCFGVGAFVAPIIIAQVMLRTAGIAWAYRLLALLMLPAVIWVARTPSPRPPAAHEQAGLAAPRPWPVFLIAALLFLFVAAEASYGGWVYSYAIKLNVGTVATAAYLTSAFWGALTLGRLVSIPLAARFRPAALLLGNILGCLAGLIIVLLGSGSLPALWAGTFIFGFAMGPLFPTTISFASTRMATTGRVTALFLIGGSLGVMLLPWLIGQLFEPLGPQIAMWLITLAMVLSAGVYGLLMVDARRENVRRAE
jgi:FHS family Na+ dependent glucose MFS transporter 1